MLRIFYSSTKTTYLTNYSSWVEHDKLVQHVECALRRSLGSLGQTINLQAGNLDELKEHFPTCGGRSDIVGTDIVALNLSECDTPR